MHVEEATSKSHDGRHMREKIGVPCSIEGERVSESIHSSNACACGVLAIERMRDSAAEPGLFGEGEGFRL